MDLNKYKNFKNPDFTQGEISPILKARTSYKEYPQLPSQLLKPIETKPISRFKAFIIYWFGAKHCDFNGYTMYLFRGKMYCLPSKVKTSN